MGRESSVFSFAAELEKGSAMEREVILNFANVLALSITALAGFISAFVLFRLQAIDALIGGATSEVDALFPPKDRTRFCLFSGHLAKYRTTRGEQLASLADAEDRSAANELLESIAGLYRYKLYMVHEFRELMSFGGLLFAVALLMIILCPKISGTTAFNAYAICGGFALLFLLWGSQSWRLFHRILLSSVNLQAES